MNILKSQLFLCSTLIFTLTLAFTNVHDIKLNKRSVSEVKTNSQSKTIKLCSGKSLNIAKCTGSKYCRACKTCEYCKHCNNGGSCGVCVKSKNYSLPSKPYYAPKYPKSKSYSTPKYPSSNSYSTKPRTYTRKKETPKVEQNTSQSFYSLTDATSLRTSPSSKSKVILRFRKGNLVTLISNYDEWWCKVEYNGRIGYVKRRLLLAPSMYP